jgi:hypothetical protein
MGLRRKALQEGRAVLSTTEVRSSIRQVLGESSLPLSVSSIVKRTADAIGLYPAVPQDEVYSPHRQYEAGQRLVYASLTKPSIFVVEEPVTESSFAARFEDGRIKRLVHNDPSDTTYDFTIEGRTRALQAAVAEGLAEMPDVAEIEGLYTLGERLEQVPFHRLSKRGALRQLAGLYEERRPGDRIDELRDACRRHDLTALYYLTPFDNLGSILRLGILAKNLAPRKHASFANPDMQSRRRRIRPRQDLALTLNDCVPLFFAPRPPLLCEKKEQQSDIVYVRVDPVVLLEPGVAFSTRNAVSAALFFTDIADLDKLNWDVLRAHDWGSDDEAQHRENELWRQAEAQIPVRVPVARFLDLCVYDEDGLQAAQDIVSEGGVSLPVRWDSELYC